jgi:hypothetical protein
VTTEETAGNDEDVPALRAVEIWRENSYFVSARSKDAGKSTKVLSALKNGLKGATLRFEYGPKPSGPSLRYVHKNTLLGDSR